MVSSTRMVDTKARYWHHAFLRNTTGYLGEPEPSTLYIPKQRIAYATPYNVLYRLMSISHENPVPCISSPCDPAFLTTPHFVQHFVSLALSLLFKSFARFYLNHFQRADPISLATALSPHPSPKPKSHNERTLPSHKAASPPPLMSPSLALPPRTHASAPTAIATFRPPSAGIRAPQPGNQDPTPRPDLYTRDHRVCRPRCARISSL